MIQIDDEDTGNFVCRKQSLPLADVDFIQL